MEGLKEKSGVETQVMVKIREGYDQVESFLKTIECLVRVKIEQDKVTVKIIEGQVRDNVGEAEGFVNISEGQVCDKEVLGLRLCQGQVRVKIKELG